MSQKKLISLCSFTIDSQTRGQFKVFKPQCTNNAMTFSFSCQRVNCWNGPSDSVRCTLSVYTFKSLLNGCDLTAILRVILISALNLVFLQHLMACLCFVVSVSLCPCHVWRITYLDLGSPVPAGTLEGFYRCAVCVGLIQIFIYLLIHDGRTMWPLTPSVKAHT